MRKSSRYSAFGGQANRFTRPGECVDEMPSDDDYFECTWLGCPLPSWVGTPVCWTHAMVIATRLQQFSPPLGPEEPSPPPEFQSFVYYLILSPTTVKIGTTQYLRERIRQLRSELQYVVALEPGDRTVERERHLQFADERRNRQREDFILSDRLKQHIDQLQPKREETMQLALSRARINDTP